MMTVTEYADGSKRFPSTVKVIKGSGVWSVTLQDDELRIQLRVEVNDLESIWNALEKALADPEAKWTGFKSYKNPERQKKKGEKKV